MTDAAAARADDTSAQDDAESHAEPRVTGVERFIAGVIFLVLFNVAEVFIFALGLVQALIALVFGGPNRLLGRVGASVALWMRDMVRFVTGATNTPAFPFARWPSVAAEERSAGPRDSDGQ
ncbi:MAG: DUF4389 domain-containing protein [Rhodobacteraceae bacterium]|nr:MAG: DUF4389 domain-containing protein [Paracoccaceae bacterium]